MSAGDGSAVPAHDTPVAAAAQDAAPPPPTRLNVDALRTWPLPALEHAGDKESRGTVLIVGGSVEIPGAVILAAQACLRAGAGKVVIATVQPAAMSMAVLVPEARVIGLRATALGGLEPADIGRLKDCIGRTAALLIGPGMQDEAAGLALTTNLLQTFEGVPTVLDAAAMDAVLSQGARGGPVLVTPHAGEMAHLSGDCKEDVLADPQASARRGADRWQAIVALKGSRTCIAHPDGRSWQHEDGHVGLGTAGSGDVLGGLIAGFAARGACLEQAAAWGVVLHAAAGARLAARIGGLGYLARELSMEVPGLLDQLDPGSAGARRKQDPGSA